MRKIFLLLALILVPTILAVESTPIKIEPMIRFDKMSEYSANIEMELPDDIYTRTYTFEIRFNDTILSNSTNETEGIYVWVGGEALTSSWDSISFDIIRDFANQTELFDIVDTCSEYIDNVTNCFTQTNTYRDKYDKIYESTLSMINKSLYDDVVGNNLSTIQNSYDTLQASRQAEVTTLNERIEELLKHRQYGWVIGIVGIGTSLYLLNKYQGLGQRKQQIETEFPKDIPA